jgi:hypothetical protein
MKFLIILISLNLFLNGKSQEVTFKVKKGEEFSGLFYTKVKSKKEYQYLMFSGKEVSVWNSTEKPKNVLSNTDYMTFAKANIKTTNFTKQDSLVTFEFKQNVKERYVFLDYHCIVENDGSLHVKISNSNELIEVERYRLVRKK